MESMDSCAGPNNIVSLMPLHLFFMQRKAQKLTVGNLGWFC
jgi:hypothetical protein